MSQRLHIDAVLERGDRDRHGARPDLQQIRAARDERLVAHPDYMRGKLVDAFGRLARIGEQISPRNVHIGFEGKGNRIALLRAIGCALEGDDFLELRGPTRASQQNVLIDGDRAGHHCPREATEVTVGAIDPLHREAERPFDAATRNVDRMKVLDQGGSAVPRHPSRDLGHVVAEPRREWNCRNGDLAEIRYEGRKMFGNIVEATPLEPDEVHLVDGEHDLPDAEQATKKGVTFGLLQHAFARVDEYYGEFRGRSTGRHVARVLLMPRCIGNDKGALRRRKETIGDVDRDALLPLVLEPVEEQREINLFTGRPEPPGFPLQRAELIV